MRHNCRSVFARPNRIGQPGARMSNEGLVRLRWRAEEDLTGELTVEAQAPTGFAGRGCAWFNTYTVHTFVARLSEYPLADPPIELVGGSQPLGGELHVSVGLFVYPVGIKGQLGIGVDLERTRWQWPTMRD